MGEFTPVGRNSEIGEGEIASYEVGGTRIAVTRVAGQFHAFDDTCTHQQCSLADGEIEGTTITCPCHGSQFDVTSGSVLNPPATEPVKTYTARVEGEELQVEV